jgi:hypothetical protein
MKKITKIQLLKLELDKLEIGESINKKEFIIANWHSNDYFTQRSFDVVLCNTKKLLPEKRFDSTVNTEIKRVA